MYRLPDGQLDIYAVFCPLKESLDGDNRFFRWAAAIPWEQLEQEWSERLYPKRGAPATTLRQTLGLCLIREKFGLSDREVIQQTAENPYMQYFVGLKEFTSKPLCSTKLLIRFRQRMDREAQRELKRMVRELMK